MHTQETSLNRQKLEQVVLFFLEKINNVHLGRTKLMKLLYYVDFDHYERHGRSITCAKYRKLPHGPVPEKADAVIKEMVSSGIVKSVNVPRGDFKQNRLITSSGEFDASLFSGDELQTLEAVANKWEHFTAKQIEDASHKEAPWASTDDGKAIDYELAEYRTSLEAEPIDDWLRKSAHFSKLVESLV
ncbi:MAG TPA: hypothetical protein DCE44_02465 [Verrucomicrobiales bacterium]|nr:hypothetical protein [Verrucomicrobiales bacterium]